MANMDERLIMDERLMRFAFVVPNALFVTTTIMAVVLLLSAPRPVLAEECWWECEKCTCDLQAGVCECTNCRMGCHSPD